MRGFFFFSVIFRVGLEGKVSGVNEASRGYRGENLMFFFLDFVF